VAKSRAGSSRGVFARALGRLALAVILLVAGVGHFRDTDSFVAQVPPFLPEPELVVYISGVVEIILGLALLMTLLPIGGLGLRAASGASRRSAEVAAAAVKFRVGLGWVVAAFFIAIFPGNVSQFITQTDAFGLDSDLARLIRLLFQPALVALALWSTGAWRAFLVWHRLRNRHRRARRLK
jgi:uncharacterized membrane protein